MEKRVKINKKIFRDTWKYYSKIKYNISKIRTNEDVEDGKNERYS